MSSLIHSIIQSQIDTARIVLVSDGVLKDETLEIWLREAGFDCQVVDGVEGVLDLIEQDALDLVILPAYADPKAHVQCLFEAANGYLSVVAVGADDPSGRLEAACLESGIERFVPWPTHRALLLSKIRSALRFLRLYQYEIEQRRELLSYWQRVDLEQEVAAKVYNNVLKSQFLDADTVKASISPMALFNGDLILIARSPSNHLHVLLGDFTGHGLSASIAAVPTAEIFYGMTRKGFGLQDIVQEINNKLCKLLPVNMFLAATAAALYPDSNCLMLITCGLPDHILSNERTGDWMSIISTNLPLGIMTNVELQMQTFSVDKHYHLYLLTDGVFEAENSIGECFGMNKVIEAIVANPRSGFEALQNSLSSHTHNARQKDDITFLELLCDVSNQASLELGLDSFAKPAKALNWRTTMAFHIDTLREINPVPNIVNLLMELQGLQRHRQSIFIIVSELFANALDHGLLGLSSAMKSCPQGFVSFYQLKEERMKTVADGAIRFSFSHEPTERGGRLIIRVVDTGQGFDWRSRRECLDANAGYSGRGIELVQSLCQHLTYHGEGNRVTAVYEWHA